MKRRHKYQLVVHQILDPLTGVPSGYTFDKLRDEELQELAYIADHPGTRVLRRLLMGEYNRRVEDFMADDELEHAEFKRGYISSIKNTVLLINQMLDEARRVVDTVRYERGEDDV